MAVDTAILKIYKCKITPERNALVENISTYLNSLTPKYQSDTFQYIKISLESTIRINADQKYVGKTVGNYLSLIQDDKTYYYFITGAVWKATNTVELSITLDTVNTFANDFTFNKKTNITRQHENRWHGKESTNHTELHNLGGQTFDWEYDVYSDSFSTDIDCGVFPTGFDFNYQLDISFDGTHHRLNEWIAYEEEGRLYLYLEVEEDEQVGEPVISTGSKLTVKYKTNNTFTVGSNVVRGKVNKVDEGINGLIKYKASDTICEQTGDLNQNWYLVYKTNEEPTNISPITCFLVPEDNIATENNGDSKIVNIWDEGLAHSTSKSFFFLKEDNKSNSKIKIHDTEYDFSLYDIYAVVNIMGGTNWNIYGGYISGTTITWTYLTYEDVSRLTTVKFTKTIKYRIGDVNATPPTTDLQKLREFLFYTACYGYCLSIHEIDRTDSKNIKLIQCPYIVDDGISWNNRWLTLPNGWLLRSENNAIELDSSKQVEFENVLNTTFDYTFDPIKQTYTYTTKAAMIAEDRNTLNDPKILHSAFTQLKAVYDNYSTDINLENLTILDNADTSSAITYKQANTITSNCLFKITDTTGATYESTEDYPRTFVATRNNESPIYTNAYINYMRTGYNFDRKNQTTNAIIGGFGLAGNLLGGGAGIIGGLSQIQSSLTDSAKQGLRFSNLWAGLKGFSKSKYVSPIENKFAYGLGVSSVAQSITGTVGSVTSYITSLVTNQRNIEQKQTEAKNQATNVSSSDDLNLLNYYNGNKVHWITYQVNDIAKDIVNDLFYYCGYAKNKQAIPNTTSRYWFNFIQCEPIFNEEEDTPYEEYLLDLKTRYIKGVTVYHNHDGYNWNQDKENWESYLVPNN